jgi:PhoPQ-activated pathogenicity-related protein
LVFLASQTWLTPEDSSRPIWTHWLVVCVPDIINKNNKDGKKTFEISFSFSFFSFFLLPSSFSIPYLFSSSLLLFFSSRSPAFLYINDGNIYNSAPTTLDPLVVIICLASESVAAELHGIPNEPITFADGISRSEDAIIA